MLNLREDQRRKKIGENTFRNYEISLPLLFVYFRVGL
jgi:hypothetical protein